MVEKEVTIKLKDGVHARPAAKFTEIANRYRSKISIKKDGIQVDGKSILSLMMLALTYGTKITISADGEDEHDAINALTRLVENNFEDG